MHQHTFIPMIASFIAIGGCQLDPKNIGTPDSASEPSTSADTGTTVSPTETSPGTADATDTSTADATDTSTSSATDTSTGEPIDPACYPPGSTGFQWPDNYIWFSWVWGGPTVNEPCVLESTEAVAEGLKLVFDCPQYEEAIEENTFEFVITAGPTPTLPAIGATIDAFVEWGGLDISDDYEMLILRSEGQLLYAAVRALHLVPYEAGPELYAPLTLAHVDLCPLFLDTSEIRPGDGFVCQGEARAQLQVSAPDVEGLLLLDGESGSLAVGETTYAVDVRRAWKMENCQPEKAPGVLDVASFAIAAQ